MSDVSATLTAQGQASDGLDVLDRESCIVTASTSGGFTGKAWVQIRVSDIDWRNQRFIEPGESVIMDGPGKFRVAVETMELGDDLTVTLTLNDDVLWSVRRANGETVVAVTRNGFAVPSTIAIEAAAAAAAASASDAASSAAAAAASAAVLGSWQQITQAAYDALSPPDDNVLYVVIG